MTRAARRYYRTILLGIAALGGLVWSAHAQFDIPLAEIGELLLGAFLATLLVIAAAALVVGVWAVLRRLLRRRE